MELSGGGEGILYVRLSVYLLQFKLVFRLNLFETYINLLQAEESSFSITKLFKLIKRKSNKLLLSG